VIDLPQAISIESFRISLFILDTAFGTCTLKKLIKIGHIPRFDFELKRGRGRPILVMDSLGTVHLWFTGGNIGT